MSQTFQAAALAAALFVAPCAMAQDAFTGAYAGLGLSFARSDAGVDGTSAHDRDVDSATINAYGGWMRAGAGNFVWGPELSISGISSGKNKSGGGIGTSEMTDGVLIGARLRGGYAMDKAFIYGSLGLGLTNAVVQEAGTSDNNWTIGGSYGVGVEFAVSDQWNARVDAQHYNLGHSDMSFGGSDRDTTFGHTTLSLGLSRKF